MKKFFGNVLSTIVGVFIAGVIFIIFLALGFGAMVASVNKTEDVKDNSVLAINMTGLMNERSEDGNLLSQVTGKVAKQAGLDQFRKGVELAKNDDHIKGIYLEMGGFAADSYATLEEAREALQDFKKSGKWVIAYADSYTQGSYYLASVADKVYLNPVGMLDWHGIASEPYYLKDALAKFGVKVQVAKVGKYKSATEMFTEDKMSDANREQTTAYLNSIWNTVKADVSRSRNISVPKLNELADSAITFSDPKLYQKERLIDGLLYTDQIKALVKKKLNIKEDEEIHQATLEDVIANNNDGDEQDSDDEIAIYYAYGDIVDGAASNPFSDGAVIDAQAVCKDLQKLAQEKDIKAVVLRINSGGGSAYASEQIWHQMMELKKKKPVVVSMGGMAASGAYYSSAPANWIVADPTTLTGSIGIFGMFPDASGLLTEKLGVKFDEVKTNKHSGFGTVARPFSPEELRILDGYITRGYQLFCHRVAQGRHMTDAQVDQIAQGHVYTGADALKIKLVDQLGNLGVAIKKAAQLAKIKEYRTANYPEQKGWLERFSQEDAVGDYLDDKMRTELGYLYEPYSLLKNLNKCSAIQARIPYEPNIH